MAKRARKTPGKGAENHAELGCRLRAIREWAGVSQSELSRRTDISQSNFSEWEKGSYAPPFSSMVKICHHLGLEAGPYMVFLATGDARGFPGLNYDTTREIPGEIAPQKLRKVPGKGNKRSAGTRPKGLSAQDH